MSLLRKSWIFLLFQVFMASYKAILLSPVTPYQIYASRFVQRPPPTLQASPLFTSPHWPFVCCFHHALLHSISVSLNAQPLEPQLISICMSHTHKTKQSEIPFAFYCLKCTISSPHVMCVFPFSSTPIFPWKLAPASYSPVTPCVWAARAWEEDGVAGKVSVTDRQTACSSWAHVFLQLQLRVDMFTFQTIHRLQRVQTGIFNYSCGLFPINKILRKKENCLLACLLTGFIPSCTSAV